jgi:hypothetical protein
VNCKKVGSFPAFLRFALTIGTFRTVVYPVRLRGAALGGRLRPFFGDGETPDAVIAQLAGRRPGYGLRARVAVGQKIQTGQKRQRGSARVPTTGRTGITEDEPGGERPSLTLLPTIIESRVMICQGDEIDSPGDCDCADPRGA